MRNAYNTYFEEEILSATPLRLVCLLYEKAISELRSARTYLMSGQVAERCAAISKACDVLAELTSSLDLDNGGDTASRLGELYQYSISRLVQANLQKEDAPIAEVLGLLVTLQEGWAQIAVKETVIPAPMPSPSVYAAQAGATGTHSWSF